MNISMQYFLVVAEELSISRAADRQEAEKIFRQKAHLKTALVFCHVPQCDVMVPAQIEKTLRFTARHTNPHTAFPESLSPLQTHTPFSALE